MMEAKHLKTNFEYMGKNSYLREIDSLCDMFYDLVLADKYENYLLSHGETPHDADMLDEIESNFNMRQKHDEAGQIQLMRQKVRYVREWHNKMVFNSTYQAYSSNQFYFFLDHVPQITLVQQQQAVGRAWRDTDFIEVPQANIDRLNAMIKVAKNSVYGSVGYQGELGQPCIVEGGTYYSKDPNITGPLTCKSVHNGYSVFFDDELMYHTLSNETITTEPPYKKLEFKIEIPFNDKQDKRDNTPGAGIHGEGVCEWTT